MAGEIVNMLNTVWPSVKSKRSGGRKVLQVQEFIRVAGGIKSWGVRWNNEVLPWYGNESETIKGIVAEADKDKDLDAESDVKHSESTVGN